MVLLLFTEPRVRSQVCGGVPGACGGADAEQLQPGLEATELAVLLSALHAP